MPPTENVAVVGGGIVGLAHAWSAARRGHRVILFERSAHAQGASIRNFGMVWPIGQPAGELRQLAMASRECWLHLQQAGVVAVRGCGSIHLAHHDDEREVLREFQAQSAEVETETRWLEPEQVHQYTPAANQQGLRGGLFSPSELGVDPRTAIRALPRWLADEHDVQCEFQTTITAVDSEQVRSSDGRRWLADRVIICAGADFATLFPEVFANSRITPCKLQMLKTLPQPKGWKLGPHLASGLTLRHYRGFESCPSLPRLKQRIADQSPELDQFGIHLLIAQNAEGEVIIGDSHEYGTDIEPFDKSLIDELILRELQKVFRLPEAGIAERWHGVYAKLPEHPWFYAEPQPRVHVVTGMGGAGMTMSFGVAERFWQQAAVDLAV